MYRKVLFAVLFIVCLSSYSQVTTGSIKTEGVVIRAEDGSFTISSEEEYWDVPFAIKIDRRIFAHYSGGNSILIGLHGEALKLGARKVRVKVPGFEKEFYGVLAFIKSPKAIVKNYPCFRQFQISVPGSYAQQALDGKTSVVYEWYPLKCRETKTYGIRPWVLWLSDVPF